MVQHRNRKLRDSGIKRSSSAHKQVSDAFATKANDVMGGFSHDERDEIAEVLRILSAKPRQFRLQFLAAVGTSVQNERNLWADDASTAVRMAVAIPRPAESARIRVLDPDGCTVFERENANF